MKCFEEWHKYFEKKCLAMHKNGKMALLQNIIKMLKKNIVSSNKDIEVNAKKKAEDGVVYEMESSGVNKSQAYGSVYEQEYKKEVVRIQNLVLKRQVAEVELFILSEQPLNDDIKIGWTEDMIMFYESCIAKNVQGDDLTNEVGMDHSAHADFMTQNIVPNVVDAAMDSMVNNDLV